MRSAGTAKSARRRVKENDLYWADIIFVMEDKRKARLRQDFRNALAQARLYVLNIPDEYQYMDAELIEILEAKVDQLLT